MYKTVMIDPPWKKSTGGVGHKSLQPSTHYDVQSREEIVATLKHWFEEYGVAPEAHLYMWAVNSFTAGKDQGIIPPWPLTHTLTSHIRPKVRQIYPCLRIHHDHLASFLQMVVKILLG